MENDEKAQCGNIGLMQDLSIWFIKQNLGKDEIDEIKKEIDEYVDLNEQLDNDLKNNALDKTESNNIKSEILTQKIDLYRFLYDYVDENKKPEFIEYIKNRTTMSEYTICNLKTDR